MKLSNYSNDFDSYKQLITFYIDNNDKLYFDKSNNGFYFYF